MMISADQVVANVCDLFEKIGGTKLDEIRLSLTATEIVLGGPFFTENDVADRVERLTDRLRNSQIDLFQDMARLRGIIYACYYGHWEGGGQPGLEPEIGRASCRERVCRRLDLGGRRIIQKKKKAKKSTTRKQQK